MKKQHLPVFLLSFLLTLLFLSPAAGQARGLKWMKDGSSYCRLEGNAIVQYTLPSNQGRTLLDKSRLVPEGKEEPLVIFDFYFSTDEQKVLIYTNTRQVWRINTRGDYWVVDLKGGSPVQLGASLPPSSLMFAKISPDGTKAAYVSEYNVYVEDLASHEIKALTTDGNRKLINGTFDWAYEEEFACRDGFRWSPDSKSVAYWQLDAGDTPDYLMSNLTDSIYPYIIPVEYPVAGHDPSSCRVGVADIASAQTTWMEVPGDPRQHYIVRMEFIPGTGDLLLQQLNRKQNESKLLRCSAADGSVRTVFGESSEAWIDVLTPSYSEDSYNVAFAHRFAWLDRGRTFLWACEKDGWRHLYRIDLAGNPATLITIGAYDVLALKGVDEEKGFVYFTASPENATQAYLYRTKLSNGRTRKPDSQGT
ncbi:MAG: DPP IV N-terminal domain-containing protein [Bacteroidales bacterium]